MATTFRTSFPIVPERPRTATDKRLLTEKLRLFRPLNRKYVAAEQSLMRGKRGRKEPIWLLHRIRIVDVHRSSRPFFQACPPPHWRTYSD